MPICPRCQHSFAPTPVDTAPACPQCGLPSTDEHLPPTVMLSDEPRAPETSLPLVLPRYEVAEVLGEGGFAVVHRAWQMEPVRREVAVKVLKSVLTSEQVLARFEAERQTLARMEHAGIARLWDAGQTATGQPYFAMELVRGLPITSYCTQHESTLRERLELMVQVCDAMQHAHAKGVLHRDIKPSNVLVTDDGQAKIIDFGIAKALEQLPDSAPSYTTAVHQAIGTPGYMSPEQTEWGAHLIDSRSDIYALGVLLYELITGSTPLAVERATSKTSNTGMGLVAASIQPPSRVPTTRLTTRTQRRDLDAILLRALEREPEHRYPSADALRQELKCHLEDKPVAAAHPSMTYVLAKLARRHRGAVAGGVIALATVLVALVVTSVGLVREQRARQDADDARAAVEVREVAVRRALSRADFAAAQRFKSQSDYQSAAVSLTRSLASDPTFTTAASDLQSLLAYGEFLQPLAPALPTSPDWGTLRLGAISADGKTIVAVFRGGQHGQRVFVWLRRGDVWQQRQIPVIESITSMSLAPSGQRLALVEARSSVWCVDLEDESARTRKWSSPGPPITTVLMDARSAQAWVGCNEGSVWQVPCAMDAPAVKFGNVRSAISRLSMADALIAGGNDGAVHRLTRDGATQLFRLAAPVAVLAVRPDGTCIAAGDSAGEVGWWSATGASRTVSLHRGAISAIGLGKNQSLITAGADMMLRWHDRVTDTEIAPAIVTAGRVDQALVDDDEDRVTIITADASVRLWQRHAGAPLTLRKPQQSRLLATHAGGRVLAVQREDGSAIEPLSLAREGAVPTRLHSGGKLPSVMQRALAFDAAGTSLWTADEKGQLQPWELETANPAAPMSAPSPVLSLRPDRDGGHLAACADGRWVRIAGSSFTELLAAPSPSHSWAVAALSPDGQGAVWAETGNDPGTRCRVRLHDLRQQKTMDREAQRIACVAYDANQQRLFEGLHNGVVRFIDLRTDIAKSFSWHLGPVQCMTLSNDGELLITGSADGTLSIRRSADGGPYRDYLRLGNDVRAVTFSADGLRFAAATEKQCMVGDVDSCAIIGLPFTISGFGGALALNANGTRVAVSDAQGVIMLGQVAGSVEAPPEWFRPLTSMLASRRFTPGGVMETTAHPGMAEVQLAVPASASGQWASFTRWILSSPEERSLTPWSSMMRSDYLNALADRPGDLETRERERLGWSH